MVQSPFLLHLFDNMTQHFLFILFQMKGLFHQMVSLHQLSCRKAHRYAGSLCMVLNKVHDTVKSPVHSALMVIGTAEIPNARLSRYLATWTAWRTSSCTPWFWRRK